MKKRFLFPLIGIGALTATCVFGHLLQEEAIKACNVGDTKECQGIAELYGTDYLRADRITNPAYIKAVSSIAAAEAKAKKETAAKEAKTEAKRIADAKAEAERFLPVDKRVAAANRTGVVRDCEATFKAALKDPGSYRYLNHNFVAQGRRDLEVHVTYTATNSFGGRVQDTQTCTYTF